MRILKKKLKMRVKTNFFILFTLCTVILRYLFIIYNKISFHLPVPLTFGLIFYLKNIDVPLTKNFETWSNKVNLK